MATVGSIPAGARLHARRKRVKRRFKARHHSTHHPRWCAPALVVGDVLACSAGWLAGVLAIPAGMRVGVMAILAVALLAWPALVAIRSGYSAELLDVRDEFTRTTRQFVELVALLAVVSVLFQYSAPHPTIIAAFGVTLFGSLLARYMVIRELRMMRQNGLAVRRVLAVGAGAGVSDLVDKLATGTEHALVVVGACAEGDGQVVEDIPVVRRLPSAATDPDAAVASVLAGLDDVAADTVCVTNGSQFTGELLRALSWELTDRGVDLVSVPGLVEVSTHRMQVRKAGVLALLHVRPARVSGPSGLVKQATDRALAWLGLLLLTPVLLVLAAAVRLSSSGPALYRHTRIGRYGERFTMWKLRTMYVGSDKQKAELTAANENDGLMFKMRQDPRVTPLGRWLRRYSLDELPQLVNVALGHMSLVGPRPPLPEEVASYSRVELRRLLVRPGMTGLWQVSGRSNLSWEETLRLDLRYVDNWSLGLDADLIWRTGQAVARGTGAY